MKMMSRTSTTSSRGVMLISLRIPPAPPLVSIAMTGLRSLKGRGLGAARRLALHLVHHQPHPAEAGLVEHLHDLAHPLVLEPPVALDHHRLVGALVRDVLERRRQAVVRYPVLVDVDVAVRPFDRDGQLLAPFRHLVG